MRTRWGRGGTGLAPPRHFVRGEMWALREPVGAAVRQRLHTLKAWCAVRLRDLWRAAARILYGMTVFDMVMELRRARGRREELFTLVVFGPLLGVPIIPPYWTLRLLPYVMHKLGPWR